MIIRTIEELKSAVGFVSLTGSIDAVRPDVEHGEEKLKKYLSDGQYDLLDTQLNSGAIVNGSDQDKLLKKSRAVVGFFALENFASKNNVSFEKSGIHSLKTGNSVPVREWMLNDLKNQCTQDAYTAVDLLLKFLESKKAIFTIWAASSSFSINKSYLVNTIEQFEEYFSINESRYTFMGLYPAMKFVEDHHIKKAIGLEYYNELKTKIHAGNTNADDNFVLNNYLRAALVYMTIARAADTMSLKLTGKGFVVDVLQNSEIPKQSIKEGRLESLKQVMFNNGSERLSECVEYLNANAAADKFPTYFGSSTYTDPAADIQPGLQNEEDSGFFHAL